MAFVYRDHDRSHVTVMPRSRQQSTFWYYKPAILYSASAAITVPIQHLATATGIAATYGPSLLASPVRLEFLQCHQHFLPVSRLQFNANSKQLYDHVTLPASYIHLKHIPLTL